MTDLLTLEQRHERAERRVNRFVDRFEPAYYDLVCHAALPLILTPELVSYLRNEFLREVPWIAEVDLLLSDLCSPVGYELYVMDADVRAYALTECSATFTAERRREVANLLISYVRYLAEHQSYLSDRELEAQQWAAMLCLGEAERQTVVSELVERFQAAEIGGAMVGAGLLDNAEIARLAQLTETLKPQLAEYPELIEYAALVSDVQLRNIALERARVEKNYVVAPGQFLRLPAALQTELLAKGRIQVGENVVPQSEPLSVPRESRVTLGTQDSSSITSRFELINELNSLPDSQFEALLFALNLPTGVMPLRSAAQGLRASALLQWIEGPTGPGLNTLQAVLEQVRAEESSAESSVSFPPLKPFEFTEAHFEEDDDPTPFPPLLQTDEFTVITVDLLPSNRSAQISENTARRILEQKTSEIKQRIIQEFEEQEIEFQLDMHSRDVLSEYIDNSEISISDKQEIEVKFLETEFLGMEEMSAAFRVTTEIRFAVDIGHFDFDGYISEIHESPPHTYTTWLDQSAHGLSHVYLQVLEELTDAEVDSVDLELGAPILVRETTELISSVAESSPDLEPFDFIVATIQRYPRSQQERRSLFGGLFSNRSNSPTEWEVQQQQQQAYRFIERLPYDIPVEMVAIPGGTFLMGSPENEPERQRSEGPKHEVTVPPFFMGRYPVTQIQWRAVSTLPQVEREIDPNPSLYRGDDRPVESVTWYDAVEFCARLSAHTGRQYRLPTEAEWEYACRAGTTTPFHFGKTIRSDLATYRGSIAYADGPTGDDAEGTNPVDHHGLANAFGLCDMHGNVWEWCQDHWHDSYEGAPTDGSAWIEGGDSDRRILRGGSWNDHPCFCRSADRNDVEPGLDLIRIGFRVCCAPLRALQRPTG